MPTFKEQLVSASKGKKKELGNENSVGIKALKVYSRGRTKRFPINVKMKERKGVVSEEDFEETDYNIEGDKPFLNRPDASSTSSHSDLDDTFLSDSAIEEDREVHLEGLSALMGEPEPLVDSNQNLDVACSSLREGEGVKEGGQLPIVAPPSEKTKGLERNTVE